MRNLKLTAIGGVLALALAALPARGAPVDQNRAPAAIGTVNYVEGQVSVNGQPVTEQQVGSLAVQQGQTIVTDQGRAEMLLTPGVVVRLDDGTAVQMISPDLTHTQVGLENGRAAVEVGYIQPANNISVAEDGAVIRLTKPGLYEFDQARSSMRVFKKGEAVVQDDGHEIKVTGEHQLALAGNFKTEKFDEAAVQDDFYNFNSLRSSYLAEANADLGPTYVVASGWGPGWIGPGWYWDPWFSAYTWLPGDGLFYSPFGWGFYAPIYFGFGGGPWWGVGHFPHRFRPGYRPTIAASGFRGGVVRGPANSFHGGTFSGRMGMYNGGFRSGGGFHGSGGFHGGGFGGSGFHGGHGR